MLKTLTFACVHFFVAFTVTYLLTGSWVLGGLIALVEPLANSVAYFFHEKAWEQFRKRQGLDNRTHRAGPEPDQILESGNTLRTVIDASLSPKPCE